MLIKYYVILFILFFLYNILVYRKENFYNIEKDIYVELEGGLCNKIRTLVGFNYFARLKNKKLYAVWKYGPECPCNFYDLFENMPNTIILLNNKKKPDNIIDYGLLNEFVAKKYNLKKNNIYINNYKNLKIKKNILDKVKKVINNKNNSNILGLHIRRTDHVVYLNRINKNNLFRDNNYYEKKINLFNKFNPNSSVYLATDNYKTQKYFCQKYNNIIYNYKIPKKSRKLRVTSCEDAIIDILILSKCKEFVGTNMSSFTNLIKTFRKINYLN